MPRLGSKISGIPLDENGPVRLTIAEQPAEPRPLELVYHPRQYVLGMGCERGASAGEAVQLAEAVIADAGIARGAVAAVASIDLKADETALHAVADHLRVPVRFFDAVRLEQEATRLTNPSDIVFAEVGCHGVAEGAALASVGADGVLVCGNVNLRGLPPRWPVQIRRWSHCRVGRGVAWGSSALVQAKPNGARPRPA